MKKILLLLLFISATVCAKAQLKIGYATRDCEVARKGEEVFYKPYKNGKIIYICMPDKAYWECGTLPASYVEFSGYYIGYTKDGVVNIRKGPGTNYPIVGKYGLDGYGDYVTFKYFNSNWLKVYEDDKAAMESSWKMKSCAHKDYRKLVFKGYIHKNLVSDFPYNEDEKYHNVYYTPNDTSEDAEAAADAATDAEVAAPKKAAVAADKQKGLLGR